MNRDERGREEEDFQEEEEEEKKDDGEDIHRRGMDTTALPMEEIGENVLPIEDFTKATGSLVTTLCLRASTFDLNHALKLPLQLVGLSCQYL